MSLTLKLALLILVILLAIYDRRLQRVPNWVTLPLILTGLLVNLPGALGAYWVQFIETWLGCGLLFAAWHMGWIDGGDAKLWMALLWLAPVNMARSAVLVMFTCLAVTGLAQILWHKIKKQPAFGIRSAGAWRAVPYAVWLFFV